MKKILIILRPLFCWQFQTTCIFFGYFSDVKHEKTDLLATDIWFHFQVGYSNAVRRNVRVKDFF